MELGKRLRQARLEAGLSQRQLCGDVITRNMLSQIENGIARPSMDTLCYLAGRLEKPIGYFLEEAPAYSANWNIIAQAKRAYQQRDFTKALESLDAYQNNEEALDDEYGLLKLITLLAYAENAIMQKRASLARELLEKARYQKTFYQFPELEQRRLLLLAQVCTEPVLLPENDLPLLVRANRALRSGNVARCMVLLEACENHGDPNWHYLRAEAAFQQEDYPVAAMHFHGAEQTHGKACYAKLEQCYRAMEDYKKAYEYACKQR